MFTPERVIVGLLSGITESFAKTICSYVNAHGKSGVVGAIVSLNGPWLVVIVCIRTNKMINGMEGASLALCFVGLAFLQPWVSEKLFKEDNETPANTPNTDN